ncbi:MAG: single-stranded-DNA-specific exonuclease RecJ [Lachnospiraceae bacterium]|nr:single-stranded-DNA-specific exonuclease RecJ [Lachnospiraceae bacterium]
MKEKWVLTTKRADFQEIGTKFQISPLLARLIRNRDVTEEQDIQNYLYGTMEDLHDPLLFKDMKKAADLVEGAIQQDIQITVASDFDDDGIFASMVLWTGIRRLGGKVVLDTPDRVSEGYGLNRRMVDEAVEKGSGMILTCDNGIAAFDAVTYAKEQGLTVVVTDHHEVLFSEEEGKRVYHYPPADAIVNHKQPDCTYPFPCLCGAGVAYKLIQVLYERAGIPKEELYDLLEYVAIATVADVMDLQGENRILVKEGLRRLSATQKTGLAAIIKAVGLEGRTISAYHIGFVIGPCFNAAGRLETVQTALSLLMETEEAAAMEKAERLKALNDERKDMTLKGVEQAIEQIEQEGLTADKVLCVRLHGCHESLVGIIAGRIRETYHRPVYVFTDAAEGLKASGRSIECYDMYGKLVPWGHLLSRFGGHPMAAGLSLPEENLPLLRQGLNQDCGLEEADLVPVVRIDAPLPVQYITEELIDQLELLEPFGKGNPKPLFAEQHFAILKGNILGKNRNVLKLQVRNRQGAVIEALYFGNIEKWNTFVQQEYGIDQLEALYQGRQNRVDLAFTYYPSVNEFRGVKTLQIVIQNYCRIPQ